MNFIKNRKFGEVKNQFLSVACANIINIVQGGIRGWTSPSLLLLQSEASPLNSGPITTDQASWIGGVANIGAFFGTFFFLFIIKRYGKKFAFQLLAVPNFVFWIIILFGRDVEYLYLARVIGGIGSGGTVVSIPLYVAEIADDSVRGALGFIFLLTFNIGVLISYSTGYLMSYDNAPYAFIALPIIFFIAFLYIPDCPQFLMGKRDYKAAKKSIRFYKNCNASTRETDDRFNVELEKVQMVAKKTKMEGENNKFKDFCTPDARRGLLIANLLILLTIFSGQPVLLTYAATIFKSSGSNLDPNISSIIMITIQLIATAISTVLVDKVGRRILFIISAFGTGAGLAVMGTYSYLETTGVNMKGYDWVPVTSISVAVFLNFIGLAPLMYVLLVEVLPLKIRADGSTYCLALVNVYVFLILKFYPILAESINMFACMWIFSGVSGLGVLFGVFMLKETKGTNINT